MKKVFNTLFLIIWPSVILSQFGQFQGKQSLRLEPLSAPLNVETTIEKNETENKKLDRLVASASKALKKVDFVEKQIVKTKTSSVLKRKMKKDKSDYSPRASSGGIEITPALTLLEFKKQIEENRKRELKKIKKENEIVFESTPKKIIIKDEKIIDDLKIESLEKVSNNKIEFNNENELSSKNIISHTGFNIEKPKAVSMLALLQKTTINNDLEKLAQAEERFKETEKIENNIKSVAELPNERRVAALNEITKPKAEDDMIFLDYSKEEKELLDREEEVIQNLQEKLAATEKKVEPIEELAKVSTQNETVYTQSAEDDHKDISHLVRNAISREMEKSDVKVSSVLSAPVGPKPEAARNRGPAILASQLEPVEPMKQGKPKKKKMNTQKVSIQNYQPVKVANNKMPDLSQMDIIKSALSATSKEEEMGGNSRTMITANEIILNSNEDNLLNSFELAPSHDLNERYTDDSSGTVKLDVTLSNTYSVFRGTILKRGMMRTIINLVLEPGTVHLDVPVFSQDTMSDILSKHNLDGRGGFLFVELNEQIDTVDIDAAYDKKIYYSESNKEVESLGDAAHVLYLGVVPGNTLIKIRTINNQYAEKVIHIVEDEVLVEAPMATEAAEQMLILKERNILANDSKELEVMEHEIKYFNRNIKATQEGNNMYKIKMPPQLLGMRKYLEFAHMNDTVYVGIWNDETLEIPSRGFIENVMGALELEDLKGRCVIQLNLKKEIKHITVSGDTIRGPMNIQHFYLDKDGTMTDEASELANKSFFVGDHQGIVNTRIDYLDGTREYLQSFCSDETYLVEHL